MNKQEYFNVSVIKEQKQIIMARDVARVLSGFCDDEPEFEQAIEQSGKTFQECLDSIANSTGRGISDCEAYDKAVKFYFSTASVSMIPHIHLGEYVEETESTFESLLDF